MESDSQIKGMRYVPMENSPHTKGVLTYALMIHVCKDIPLLNSAGRKRCQIPGIVGRCQQLHAVTLDVFLPSCIPT